MWAILAVVSHGAGLAEAIQGSYWQSRHRDGDGGGHSARHGHGHRRVSADFGHPEWLSSCRAIYLDLGSHLGVQVRKFYEPDKYPEAKVLPYFDSNFGPASWRQAPASFSCALGLEPNPDRLPRLQRLQQAYNDRGWRTHFYPFAAWSAEGHMVLNKTGGTRSLKDTKGAEAHLMANAESPGANSTLISVRTVDLADFIESLPKGTVRVAKFAIEGAEYEALAQLFRRKMLCRKNGLETILMEVHSWGEVKHWGSAESFQDGIHPRSMDAVRERVAELQDMKACQDSRASLIAEFDDETFAMDVDEKFQEDDSARLMN